ncbi:MAG: hypothetical protein B7X41_15890 [Microbacterium sp. 14-71-5]|uniref:hypothetical protein n=1 Tax=Microbacterium sp. 13-71-7 TaxID=1970399 RepID=UPI000BC8DE12|nr:hypothetical protein [Microbacterium sp. 13-71-7]OZB82751.1 MAG: hypothetical protein B7X41_15890 [Microbacterium sp. 14-71-5]OZB84991.1 MAG: hypothetical protein B7X32_05265 [Microbacterium sp. 13-71-7]
MPSHPLAPDTALSIKIGCVMTRNQYTQDPGPVIAELYATAGTRIDLLTQEVGMFIGFYDDQYRATLVTALRALPLDMDEAIKLGQFRRGLPAHGTGGYHRPRGVTDMG